MNPDAQQLWKAPRWALAVLLAVLGMLGPFSIDTYIPAFSSISHALNATPVQMQQTLSAYLFGFAFMNLFHGALSDSFGRRPVVLWGLVLFTLNGLGFEYLWPKSPWLADKAVPLSESRSFTSSHSPARRKERSTTSSISARPLASPWMRGP